ncbi:MAG: hypothetical protein H7Y88_04640, partial [Phycisphaerales bacterium]|nr:hypothetical protein [Phycisphaerales bacterium]
MANTNTRPSDLLRLAGLAATLLAAPAFAQNEVPPAPTAPIPAPAQPVKQPTNGEPARVAVSEHDTVDLNVKDEDLVGVLELL